MSDRPRFETIDAYIAAADAEVRPILQRLRETIQSAVPDATETISYQLPAFMRKSVFVYFAAFKSHIGVYPPVGGDEALAAELERYRGPNGNLKFPLSEPIPYELIGRVATTLAQETIR